MTTYIAMGKDKFTAANAAEFVQKMHKSAHIQERSDAEFMAEVSRRCKLQTGDDISHDSAENFLADLIATKYVTIDEEN